MNKYNFEIVLLVVVFVFAGCGEGELSHNNLPKVHAPSPLRFKKGPIAKDLEWISRVKLLSDVFTLEKCIQLEDTDIAHLGMVIDVKQIRDRWFLIDMMLGLVVSYDSEGRFLGIIGGKGQGPGEYGTPKSLAVWGDRLLVYDSGRAEYQIFDWQGQFLQKFDSRSQWITPSRVLPVEDKFFLLGFSSRSQDAPYHAMMQVQDNKLTVLAGFGERHPRAISQPPGPDTLPLRGLTSCALVGQRVWLGSPYETKLEVFDLDGRSVGVLPTGVDGLTISDHKMNQSPSEFAALIKMKFMNWSLLPVDDIVIAYFGRGSQVLATIYDTEGNLISNAVKVASPFHGPMAKSMGDRLAIVLSFAGFSMKDLGKILDKESMDMFLSAGYEPGSGKDAFFLFESRLKTLEFL